MFGMCGFVGRVLCGCCDLCWGGGVRAERCMSPLRVPLFLSPARCRGASRCVCCRRCRFVLPPFSWPARVRDGIVVGAWGIDHVSVGSVPPRATGVRPSGACRVRVSISVAVGAWCGPAASVFVFGADVAGSVTGVALGGLGVVGAHFFFWSREGGVIFPAFLV